MARYEDDFKEHAVGRVESVRSAGGSQAEALREVSGELDVPVGTLRGWIRAGITGPEPDVEDAPARTSLVESVNRSVSAMPWLAKSDDAAVELARAYATRIDEALDVGEGQEITKALYLGPHLLNTMRAIGGTPEERKKLTEGEEVVGGKLAQLRSIEGGRGKKRSASR